MTILFKKKSDRQTNHFTFLSRNNEDNDIKTKSPNNKANIKPSIEKSLIIQTTILYK
jgi:hypothetical protein